MLAEDLWQHPGTHPLFSSLRQVKLNLAKLDRIGPGKDSGTFQAMMTYPLLDLSSLSPAPFRSHPDCLPGSVQLRCFS